MEFLRLSAGMAWESDWELQCYLKYITPFGYTDGADIIANGSIEVKYLSVGLMLMIIGILAAFWKYEKKDIL